MNANNLQGHSFRDKLDKSDGYKKAKIGKIGNLKKPTTFTNYTSIKRERFTVNNPVKIPLTVGLLSGNGHCKTSIEQRENNVNQPRAIAVLQLENS